MATTSQAPIEAIRALEDRGAQVLVLPADAGRVSLPALLEELGARQVQSLLVEGGAVTLGVFFDSGTVNQFYFFYAPKILGGRESAGHGGRSGHRPPGRGPISPGTFIIQLIAAFLAFRLVWITKRKTAWVFIATAILLMVSGGVLRSMNGTPGRCPSCWWI